jgi:phospholipid transport system transporter-binding protein
VTENRASETASVGGFAASNDGWIFAGALTFDDAADVLRASQELPLPANGVVDFSGLTHADSAALAVVIALKRRAAGEGRTLTVRRLPASLQSLAVVYGVENLIAG